jgi:hypothetical protein
MQLSDISCLRARNQHIVKTEFSSAKDLVSSMGAMQAQDLAMAKWAVGLRLQHSTDRTVENAFNNGEIIRTHLMRPTWHFVSADDIYWLLELTAPQIMPVLKSRNIQLELTEQIFSKCYKIIEKELINNISMTRDELSQIFEKESIKTDENRFSHLMIRAELDGLICSGPLKNNKLTYVLLPDRVPNKKILTKDESLRELAKNILSAMDLRPYKILFGGPDYQFQMHEKLWK